VETGRRANRHIDDDWVRRARRVRANLRDDSKPMQRRRQSRKDADILAALRLATSESSQRWELQARLLTCQPLGEVAEIMGLPLAVVQAFEALFFAVRDRLHAPAWIITQVLGPGAWHGFARSDIGKVWMALAYQGGPRVLELVMAVTRDQPLPLWAYAGSKGNRRAAEAEICFEIKKIVAGMMQQPAEAGHRLLMLDIQARGVDGRGALSDREKAMNLLLRLSDQPRKARTRGSKKPKDSAPVAPQALPSTASAGCVSPT
jgi:hypothetical protein